MIKNNFDKIIMMGEFNSHTDDPSDSLAADFFMVAKLFNPVPHISAWSDFHTWPVSEFITHDWLSLWS